MIEASEIFVPGLDRSVESALTEAFERIEDLEQRVAALETRLRRTK